MSIRRSIKGTIVLLFIAVLLLQSLMIGLGIELFMPELSLPLVALLSVSSLLSVIVMLILLQLFYRPIQQLISALETGVSSFKDKDFSVTIHNPRLDELSRIVDAYNDMSSTLREERMSLFQRELLLDTIIQSSPLSVILTDQSGYVVYANGIAKQLFRQSINLEGLAFNQLLAKLPDELRDATLAGKDGLASLMLDNERVSWYVHCQTFVLNSTEHHLYLYKNLTTEMSRQEIDLWKNAIRLISHELNNSLAPVTSLANSAKKILASDKHLNNLPDIIDTIAKRVKKLNAFLKEYAEFARLPSPHLTPCKMPEFIAELVKVVPFDVHGEVPDIELQMDVPQMEQVLINLYKNASEAGSDKHDIRLSFVLSADVLLMTVSDAGGGMSDQQLQQALLPFYTTKPGGSGLGLSLCNEIVTAHNGFIRLQNNNKPGLDIRITLPIG